MLFLYLQVSVRPSGGEVAILLPLPVNTPKWKNPCTKSLLSTQSYNKTSLHAAEERPSHCLVRLDSSANQSLEVQPVLPVPRTRFAKRRKANRYLRHHPTPIGPHHVRQICESVRGSILLLSCLVSRWKGNSSRKPWKK